MTGPGGRQRVAIERAQVAAAPPGAISDPAGLERVTGLRWYDCALPNTAAGAMRAAKAWHLDERRAFDGLDWWWRIPLPEGTRAGDRLGFEGVATLWDAWLDGEWSAAGDNMFIASAIELERPAKELVIRCRSIDAELAKKRPRPRWRVPMLEQQQLRWIRTTLLGRTPGWSPGCAPVGPWRPLWLERAGGLRVGVVSVDAQIEANLGFVVVGALLDERVESATLRVTRGADRIAQPLAKEAGSWIGTAAIAEPTRWWPHTHGEPALYELAIDATIGRDTATIELGASGFRTVSIERGGDATRGDFAVRINDVPVFCRGACWTPLDVATLHAPREAYATAIAQARTCGMNMLRVGGTMIYEDDAFYDALDAAGILLWQDFMFANMDYPDDADFVRGVTVEVDQQLARLRARPSFAIACGNSEGGQQAAMAGAPRERWAPALFHDTLAAHVKTGAPGVAYVPSSTSGGAFPHEPRSGVASYYGVGAYLRPLDDARRSEVRFASECLAFANIPSDAQLPKVHSAEWKLRSPRDLGAGWDFDDVRDHYVRELYGVDPVALRVFDHERYLALGRAASGEVMARTFAEWRRARSPTRGALVWFLRDLVQGAGWGVVDAHGSPKPCWYALRRALAPQAIAITDEGCNGLAVHVWNERPVHLAGKLVVTLWRGGDVQVGRSERMIEVAARDAIEVPIAELFDGWIDLSFAYRFGPPTAEVVRAAIHVDERELAAWWFPAGMPSVREPDVGLAVEPRDAALAISTRRFAQSVAIEGKGFVVDDGYFHLAPGEQRVVAVPRGARGTISALNSERTVRFEVA